MPSAHGIQAGILLMIGASLTFGAQDGLSRLLAESYGPVTVIAIRFWFFALFVLAFAATRPGGIRRVAKSKRPVFQTLRGLLLITQICTAVYGFTMVGLVGYQVIFASYPLMVAALSVPFLGERVGWRRWLAIAIGLAGVLIIIRPGMEGFSVYSIWALVAVGCVTIREIATRKLSADLPSLFVALATAIAIGGLGAVMLPAVEWAPLSASALSLICGASLAIIGGYLFSVMTIRIGDIGFVAPFRYTAMVWALILGLLMFGEIPDLPTITGTVIIILTGLYSLHRERSVRPTTQKQAHQANQGRD